MTETPGPSNTPPAPPLAPAASQLRFVCDSCGAQTAFAAGTTVLRCPSCGAEQHIGEDRLVEEHSYDAWAAVPAKPVATIGKYVLQCQGCGATTETDMLAGTCQFCAGVLVALQNPQGLIAPEAVLPFGVDKRKANDAFATWVRSRWFAPSALKQVGSTEAIRGTYVPHWTFDAQTETDYTGERGEHYYTTETYTVTDNNGQTHTETRQVQHTAWYGASGHVSRAFDDVVVPASHRLPPNRLEKMGPWTLASAVAYQPQYVAGYDALRYDVDPDAGLAQARQTMESVVKQDCRSDIGGDEQRLNTVDIRYFATMFKLMLLPLWIASYIYAGKTYQVLVNANTGEVVGDRPYSKVKIAVAVVGGIVVVCVGIWLYMLTRSHQTTQ